MQAKLQNTINLSAETLEKIEFQRPVGVDIINYGPGTVWLSWSGKDAEIEGSECTQLKAGNTYASDSLGLGQSREISMISDAGAVVAINISKGKSGFGGVASSNIVTGKSLYETDSVETYDADALVNTIKTIELDLPSTSRNEYAITIKNDSEVSDIVAYIFADEDDLGDVLLTSITIPKKQTLNGVEIGGYKVLTHGMFVGVPSKIKISNLSQDPAEYDVTVRAREVG